MGLSRVNMVYPKPPNDKAQRTGSPSRGHDSSKGRGGPGPLQCEVRRLATRNAPRVVDYWVYYFLKTTASGRVTRRASSDPACFPHSGQAREDSRMTADKPRFVIDGEAFADVWEKAWTAPTRRPQRGQPHGDGPLGGAFLIPRPLAVDPYSLVRSMSRACRTPSLDATPSMWVIIARNEEIKLIIRKFDCIRDFMDVHIFPISLQPVIGS